MTDTSGTSDIPPPDNSNPTGVLGVGGTFQPPAQPLMTPGAYSFLNPMTGTHPQIKGSTTFTPKVLYHSGDEWALANGMTPETRGEVQQAMKSLGLISAKAPIQYQKWDSTTAAAFKQVLEYANTKGTSQDDMAGTNFFGGTATGAQGDSVWNSSWQSALQDMIDAGPAPAAAQALPVIKITSPEDIRAMVEQGAKALYGSGNIDPAQMDKIIAGYQAQESSEQSQAAQMDTSNGGTGGTVTDPASLTNFVTDQLTAANPQKVEAQKVVGGLLQVHQLLSGSGGANA